jgi:uncharacterized protein (TIGR03792 family)
MIKPVCLLLVIAIYVTHGSNMAYKQGNTIEMLVFTVRRGDMQHYLTVDNAIWTTFLRAQDGFISKRNLFSSRQSMDNATEIYQFIEWESLRQWKDISEDELMKTNEKFIREFGYQPNITALPDDDGFQEIQIKPC